MDRFIRQRVLIGNDAVERLSHCHILVVGVGGVGGYVVECLARAGVGNITLCDGDTVDISNINRQIIALDSTVGRYKCDVFCERIKDINPECNVRVFNCRFNIDTASEILSEGYDYIVDAIDSLSDKVELVALANEKNIPIISAMGAGNRYALTDFEIVDIFATTYDKLAKKMRKLLKDRGIPSLMVAYTKSESQKVEGVIGSISYLPPLMGIKIGGYVINCLIQDSVHNNQ